ncbi:nitrous oxide reductase family maturation protein NosD [Sulfurimonas sp. SWIR-19]|uniref:nitrous oxide reductase family maturation protein NosD n=1 Tax=Sulfurimonas sp. SWIR-19 TaxID=2878390 RepID=UPI001CF4DFB3|nr:nitrous oxide reductase family maturation protein NosD [Sulfurimonas sp. SWIR-19]UCN00097.1 nitrous oxide reductase family maturation protein NosD [Sulfurimonas sp. SWIR-19]
MQTLWKRFINFISIFFLAFVSSLFANPLQDALNKAKPDAVIKLHNGIYYGNLVIDKPVTLVGIGENVEIRGDGNASVITIHSSRVCLKNLLISNSGKNMQKIDAAVALKQVKHCEISNCRVQNVLYGIDMDRVEQSFILHNDITVAKNDIALRGNGLKLYYSHYNTIRGNSIHHTRDVTLNYSHHNLLQDNTFTHNRFATYLELSNANVLQHNRYMYNSVGMMFMGAKDTKILANKIYSSTGAAGIGVMIGDVSDFIFTGNSVRYNAKGIYIQGAEKARGMKRFFKNNEIAYNAEALHFHASIRDNTIVHNKFFGNIDDVLKDIGGDFDASNVVEYNYWDRYDGFDANGDGIGDTPYRVYQHADLLWQENHKVKFFYAAPVMSLLDFLLKLAPFIEPDLIMEDKKPIFRSF